MKPALLLLLSALALCGQEKTVDVTGSVVNSVTGAGIDGATVTLAPGSKNTSAYHAVTDSAGSFRIGGVKPGEYGPQVQKSGFLLPLTLTFGRYVHVDQDAPPLRLELIPPGRLRGRVIDLEGKPAANVEVATGNQYTITTKTNEDGDFVLGDLQPGLYSLMTRASKVRTYFPATTNPTLAEVINLAAGADQGGYEIRLQPAPATYRVRGVVLDAAGKPAPKTVVEVLPVPGDGADGGLLSMTAGTTRFTISSRPTGAVPEREDPAVTGSDGVFEFAALPEGDWIFRIETEDLIHGTARVSVRHNIDDVGDLKIRLESPIALAGAVTLSDGSLAADKQVVIRLNSVDGAAGSVAVSDKGNLEFKNFAPGRFRIQGAAPAEAGYYVASVTVGTTDATDEAVSLNAASPPIRVILKPGSTISGTVEKGEWASVLLVPQALAVGGVGWLRECGASNAFEFTGLPPGGYYAIAVLNVDLRMLQGFSSLDHLQALVRDATAVRVDEGAVASVQLKPPR